MTGPLGRRHLLGLGAVVVGGWAAGWLVRRLSPVGDAVDDAATVAAVLADDGGPATGPADASLRMAVFTDYRCPACRTGFAPLEAAVAEDRDVRLLYRDWPIFGPPSERAARVALAATGQGLYAAVHRGLMTEPRPLGESVLRDVVSAAGGDWPRLEHDLAADRAAIDARLLRTAHQARALRLPGTPGYLAGNRLAIGALDASGFARLFAAARNA